MTRQKKTSSWLLGVTTAIAAQCFAQTSLADPAVEGSRPIVLKAAHLFDSVSGKMVEQGVVVVAGSKIVAVGSDVKIPDNAQVIDLGDATLLPGFIDAHVHLSQQGSTNWYHDW
ncbi:MAG: amidohydrolase family protein, partial [Gammaproteobacteria bacterium]